MKKVGLTILILISAAFQTWAQEIVHVAEKSIEKEVPVQKGDRLEVKSEKAAVIIKKTDGDRVKIKIVLATKNVDKEVAARDLTYLKYAINQSENLIFVGTSFNVPDGITRITSSMLVRIEVDVPAKLEIRIVGRYSDITANEVNGKNTFDLYFGSLQMSSVSGSTVVEAEFADVSGEHISGSCSIDGVRSDVSIAQKDIRAASWTLRGKAIEIEDGIDTKINRNGRSQSFDHKSSTTDIFKINSSGSIQIKKIEP